MLPSDCTVFFFFLFAHLSYKACFKTIMKILSVRNNLQGRTLGGRTKGAWQIKSVGFE